MAAGVSGCNRARRRGGESNATRAFAKNGNPKPDLRKVRRLWRQPEARVIFCAPWSRQNAMTFRARQTGTSLPFDFEWRRARRTIEAGLDRMFVLCRWQI